MQFENDPEYDSFVGAELPIESVPSGARASIPKESSRDEPFEMQSEKAVQEANESVWGKATWMLSLVAVFLFVWYVGPNIVEQYRYAVIKGETRANYDVARVALKDDPLSNLSTASQLVANKIRPSVVHIDTTATDPDGMGQFGSSFGFRFEGHGQGSGVIMDSAGYILTNEHVVANASQIRVTLCDRRTYEAQKIGSDRETDLAVLKISATGLIPAEWGNSDQAPLGSLVWAVGSPFGLEQSVTSGIVSAIHRRIENPFQDLLQTDAAVNPGNSGGPLVNQRGEVIGINTSILGKSFQGVSFAISSSVARNVYEQLKTKRTMERGYLGVSPTPVSFEKSQKMGLDNLNGAFIEHVSPNSPAEQAGLEEGDIILKWNGVDVETDLSLFRLVGSSPVDSLASVVVVRRGQRLNLQVKVAKHPGTNRF